MNFFEIGSMQNYTKTLDLQNRWNMRKKSSYFEGNDEKSTSDFLLKQAHDVTGTLFGNDDNSQSQMQSIYTKIYSGKDLTYEEMQLLAEKDPSTYNKLKADKAEQEAVKEKLKRCKTKEEVERVKADYTSRAMSELGAVANNPNIPKAAKLAVAQRVMGKLIKLNKVMDEFVEEGNYAKLPTAAEKFKAEQDIKEAEQAQREEIAQNAKEMLQTDKPQQTENENAQSTHNAENAQNIETEKVQAKKPDADFSEGVKTADGKMTKIEAENTPEARKLRRAKVSYEKCDFSAQTVVFTSKRKSEI